MFIECFKTQQELINEHNWKAVICVKGGEKFRLSNTSRLVAVSNNPAQLKINNGGAPQVAAAQTAGANSGSSQPTAATGGGNLNGGATPAPSAASGMSSSKKSGSQGDSFPSLPKPAASVADVLNRNQAAAVVTP